MSGKPSSMFPNADFDVFPLSNPGLVSIPLAFVFGIVGTYIGRKKLEDSVKRAKMEVRSLTGAGVEKVVSH